MVTRTVQWADDQWELNPKCGIYWPSKRALVIADPHFGKDASFRSRGLFVPAGTTVRDLVRLDCLIGEYQPERLLILGDFFHTKESLTDHLLSQLLSWRGKHASLLVTNIRGNHDSHAGDPPPELRIDVQEEPHCLNHVELLHHPGRANTGFSLAGHVHPAVRLSESTGVTVKLACFWISIEQIVLPAFGGFTGTGKILPSPGDRIFVIADDDVIEIPVKGVKGDG